MIGGNLAVRRASLAHIVFSVGVGVLSMLILGPLTTAAGWVGEHLGDSDGVLAMAAFSSLFKVAGILAVYPWLGGFARWIERISGPGTDSAVSRLAPTLAEAGAPVAFEAGRRAIVEVARGCVDALRRRLAGEPVTYAPEIEQFLASLPLETTDLGEIGPPLVRLFHALDHLAELDRDLTKTPPPAGDWQPPEEFLAGARALAGLLEASREPGAPIDPAVFAAVAAASQRLSEQRKMGRETLLEDVALQRMPAAAARAGLDALVWADLALYHAWRLAESLREAAGR
jgi:phosphate:Na+ symporter